MVKLTERELMFATILNGSDELSILDICDRYPVDISRRVAGRILSSLIRKGFIILSRIKYNFKFYRIKKCAKDAIDNFKKSIQTTILGGRSFDSNHSIGDTNKNDLDRSSDPFCDKEEYRTPEVVVGTLADEKSEPQKNEHLALTSETMGLVNLFNDWCRKYYRKAGAGKVSAQNKVKVIRRVKTEEAFKEICDKKWEQMHPNKEVRFLPKPSLFWDESTPCTYLDYFNPDDGNGDNDEAKEVTAEEMFPRLSILDESSSSKKVEKSSPQPKPVESEPIETRKVEPEKEESEKPKPYKAEILELDEVDIKAEENTLNSLDLLFESEKEKDKERDYINKHIRSAGLRLHKKYDFSIFKNDEFYAFSMNTKTGDLTAFNRLSDIRESKDDAWENLFFTIENNGYGIMKMLYRFDIQKYLKKEIDMNPEDRFGRDSDNLNNVCGK